MPKVQGITKASLWKSWRNVRKQLSRTLLRDVTDFVEYDIDPDWWIKRLLVDIEAGHYEPTTVHRFSVAKKMGFSRRMFSELSKRLCDVGTSEQLRRAIP